MSTRTHTQTPWRGVAKRVLLISGVHPPPDDPEEAAFYDVLVHETQWYAPQVGRNRARARPVDVTVRAGHVTAPWASLLPRSREGRHCFGGGGGTRL
jgi:hypothetical protein